MMDSFGNLVRRNLFLPLAGLGIAWNGSMWVAVGEKGTRDSAIFYSYDGKTWQDAAVVWHGYGVAWGNDKWVAVGGVGGGGWSLY